MAQAGYVGNENRKAVPVVVVRYATSSSGFGTSAVRFLVLCSIYLQLNCFLGRASVDYALWYGPNSSTGRVHNAPPAESIHSPAVSRPLDPDASTCAHVIDDTTVSLTAAVSRHRIERNTRLTSHGVSKSVPPYLSSARYIVLPQILQTRSRLGAGHGSRARSARPSKDPTSNSSSVQAAPVYVLSTSCSSELIEHVQTL